MVDSIFAGAALASRSSRRTFLGQTAGLMLTALASGCDIKPTSARVARRTGDLPSRQRGGARTDVRSAGARGDGTHDDTLAFQDAIDALPADGGTVHVPAGIYLIDAVRSVRLRNRMHLQMSPGAELVAKPNDAERAYILYVYRVSDVEISGGRITGDRTGHLGTSGEWGHGIQLRGAARVTIRDIRLSQCWGDGICIGSAKVPGRDKIPSSAVSIGNVVSTGNRRQGLSIGGSHDVYVYDSEFSDTSGTAPSCGIDIEPDGTDVMSYAHIENCLIRGNEGNGLVAYKRVNHVVIKRCLIERNGGYGILAIGSSDGIIKLNTIRHNYLHGVALRTGAADFIVAGNFFQNNHTRLHGLDTTRPQWSEVAGTVAGIKGNGAGVQVTDLARDIQVGVNHFAK